MEPENTVTCVERCCYYSIASEVYLQHIMHDYDTLDITVFPMNETA